MPAGGDAAATKRSAELQSFLQALQRCMTRAATCRREQQQEGDEGRRGGKSGFVGELVLPSQQQACSKGSGSAGSFQLQLKPCPNHPRPNEQA